MPSLKGLPKLQSTPLYSVILVSILKLRWICPWDTFKWDTEMSERAARSLSLSHSPPPPPHTHALALSQTFSFKAFCSRLPLSNLNRAILNSLSWKMNSNGIWTDLKEKWFHGKNYSGDLNQADGMTMRRPDSNLSACPYSQYFSTNFPS